MLGSMGPTVFPTSGMRVLSALIHFTGASICAFCFARRSATGPDGADMLTMRGLANVPWTRWCVIFVFIDSWFFEVISGLVIHGIGLSTNDHNCDLGIIVCIALYTSSKFFIYLFLTERVFIVWNAGSSLKRWQSPVYCVCALIVAVYAAVIVLMSIFRISERHDDTNVCHIGLAPSASIALLTYDLFINLWLTGLFLWPLARASLTNSNLRRVATRTLAAAAVALTTSTVNILILAVFHGKEPGWICLASCGGDVTVNALVLFWVTTLHTSEHDSLNNGLKTISDLVTSNGKQLSRKGDIEQGIYDGDDDAIHDKLGSPTRSQNVWRLQSPSLESWEAAGRHVRRSNSYPLQHDSGFADHRRNPSRETNGDSDVDDADLEFMTTQSAELAHMAERELDQRRSRDALLATARDGPHRAGSRSCSIASARTAPAEAPSYSALPTTPMQTLSPLRAAASSEIVRPAALNRAASWSATRASPSSTVSQQSTSRRSRKPLVDALSSFGEYCRGTKRTRVAPKHAAAQKQNQDPSPTTTSRSTNSISPIAFVEHDDAGLGGPSRIRHDPGGMHESSAQSRIPSQLRMAGRRGKPAAAARFATTAGALPEDDEPLEPEPEPVPEDDPDDERELWFRPPSYPPLPPGATRLSRDDALDALYLERRLSASLPDGGTYSTPSDSTLSPAPAPAPSEPAVSIQQQQQQQQQQHSSTWPARC
ncbi:hypothetical protein BKA62DRAFT_170861 [Auriculariales sp. MPI-PUGE-AT-0066]|nr:hypothetical protein BKA62DRAFT_170861 [Auriculariales sp. MPI-PUGE-AT-0066]